MMRLSRNSRLLIAGAAFVVLLAGLVALYVSKDNAEAFATSLLVVILILVFGPIILEEP
jgi:hypothetical protein